MIGVQALRAAWFAGAGSHTALGTDTAAALAGLDAVSEPARVPLEIGAVQTGILYRLLPDRALEGLESRLYEVLGGVVEQALLDAGTRAPQRERMGLFLGSSSADVSVSEARFRRELATSDDAIALRESNSLANLATYLRRHFGLRGPDYSFNTACTASANALAAASSMVQRGRLDNALVVGAELFNVLTAAGFQSLGLLAPTSMRPFDHDRAGLTPGEGCSALVLSAESRNRSTMALLGSATLCDTYSMSTTHPDGSTVALVIRQALAQAGLTPDDIAAIKVHGTASLHSDEAEAAGMRAVFDPVPPLFALKPHLGHTLGACGLNELVLFREAAIQGVMPGTPGIAAPGRADLGLSLNQSLCPLPTGPVMLNYFGFGGNNTSLIVACND